MTTRSDRRAKWTAVMSPLKPPPTIATSRRFIPHDPNLRTSMTLLSECRKLALSARRGALPAKSGYRSLDERPRRERGGGEGGRPALRDRYDARDQAEASRPELCLCRSQRIVDSRRCDHRQNP